jgi:magnesium-transporting ATPase (P-type)
VANHQTQVERRRAEHGPNELDQEEDEPLWRKYLDQFKDPLIGLLLASAFVSVLVKQYDDAVSIALAVAIVSTVAFVQEYRSEQSIAALANLIPPTCNCLRDGVLTTVEAKELVPGDVVVVSLGDRVPADCRVVAATDLLVDESSLTGESKLVEKGENVAPDIRDQLRHDLDAGAARRLQLGAEGLGRGVLLSGKDGGGGGGGSGGFEGNAAVTDPEVKAEAHKAILFMGTTVQHGHGRGVVVATGMKTDFGKTFQEMKDVEQRKTPLQASMDQLGQRLSFISFGVIGCIAVVGLLQGSKLLDMFTIGVSLAVAAIPEGLPICVTVTLAFGVMRMAKRHAIVKKLPAVEALGCATTICVDKTGTLTCNEMTVTHVLTASGLLGTGSGSQNPSASGSPGSPPPPSRSPSSALSASNGVLEADDHEALALVDEVDGASVRLSGVGFNASGSASLGGAPLGGEASSSSSSSCQSTAAECSPPLASLLTVASLCNNAEVRAPTKASAPPGRGGGGGGGGGGSGAPGAAAFTVVGQATEAALLLAGAKCGLADPRPSYQRLSEVAFSSDRKRMQVQCRALAGEAGRLQGAPAFEGDSYFVKGSLEGVLDHCATFTPTSGQGKQLPPRLSDADRRRVGAAARALASKGLRVLCVAHGPSLGALCLDGLVGMADPPRPGVKASVAELQAAKSRVAMVTGDARDTALAVARDLGFYDPAKVRASLKR